ncbi:MAG: 5-methyltetrahydropteroyltriglutamate--homocysteine methyltransferase, partial [Paucilactobacillus nenjiangensis]
MTETQTFTKRTTAPFRFDVVGSFLRPTTLKNARAKYADGEITATDLKKVEDEAIIHLIKQEEAAGIQSITDGEFRRSWWHLDFFWGLQGVKKVVVDKGYVF